MKTVYKLSMSNCAPCKQYAPTFLAVKEQLPEYTFLEVSVEDEVGAQLAAACKIRSVPATIVAELGTSSLENTLALARVKLGVLSEQQLKDFISEDNRC